MISSEHLQEFQLKKRKEVTYDNNKSQKNQHFTLSPEDTGLKKLIDTPLPAFQPQLFQLDFTANSK